MKGEHLGVIAGKDIYVSGLYKDNICFYGKNEHGDVLIYWMTVGELEQALSQLRFDVRKKLVRRHLIVKGEENG